MKTIRTLACPKIFWLSLLFPLFFFVLGIIMLILTKSSVPNLFFVAAAFVWLNMFFQFGNAYSISRITSDGISNRHISIQWVSTNKFIVSTSWFKTGKYNYTGINRRPPKTMCIYFGHFNENSIRRQNVKECVILPTSKRVLNAIKFYRPELYEKIINEMKLESHFGSRWDSDLYN